MKKKIYSFFALAMCLTAFGSHAQMLLDEGFENVPGTSATETLPDGWTTENGYTGSTAGYRWTIGYSSTGSTMSGHRYAYVNAPTYVNSAHDGLGPRVETLLTPELYLDDTYQLSFDWEAAAYSALSQGQYTLQVGVRDMATGETDIIFDFTNEQQVRDSGVPADPYGQYLWGNWAVQTSKLDLAAYEGKTVKIVFIYNMLKQTANILYLDNISIVQHKPLTGPIAQVSQTSYQFPTSYLGEKLYSEVLTLKNVGLKGLKVTGFEAPDAIGLVMDTENIDLGVNETARFQLYYLSSLMSPTEADVVLKTNGGDVTIHVSASKQAIPDGYQLELFEGAQFPPAGWVLGNGVNQFTSTGYAIEGDKSLYGSGYIEDSYISTPRLDLSDPNKPATFMFTYYAQFSDQDETIPGNDLVVQVSTDGGKTFIKDLWTSDYTKMDTLINVSIDLSAYRTDSVVLRFKNTACYYDSEMGMDPAANYIIDRVLLPGVAGADGVPFASDVVAPGDSATNVFHKNIVLRWTEAQFAEGYRLYVGKAENTWDVVNGEDLGNALTYIIALAENSTTYFWKVVPYNSVGDASDVPVWCFTTQADQSIGTLPWNEDFEGDVFVPLGWLAEGTNLTKWTRSDYFPFDGKYSAMAYSNAVGEDAVLTTPDIRIPADGQYQLSFWWGNDRPVNLKKDDQQVHLNNTTREDGIDAVYFDIYADGQWQQVTFISNNAEGVDDDGDPLRYWCYEAIDLTPYAGKTITLRWRYTSQNYNRSRGAALDNVKIAGAGASVTFSLEAWDAYKVNANKSETSPTIAVTNLGNQAVKVKEVKFANPGFTTTLKAGDEIEAAGSRQFTVTFKAGTQAGDEESVEIDDEMVVTFEDGSQATMGLAAIAMGADMRYYGFEHDNTGVAPEGFTVMDVDGQSTSPLNFWDFPNNGRPLSFFVLNADQCYNSMAEPHGRQSLMTRCNTEGAFNDWIVSGALTATERSRFEFDMRNWESINSIMPSGCPTVKVMVSTTSATDRSSFTQVGYDFTPELYNEEAWDHLSYDLSQFAGQRIFIALNASASDCLGAFYDNFEFAHFTSSFDINNDGMIDVTDVNILIDCILGKDDPNNYGGRADINGDSQIDVTDVDRLIDFILGK